MEQFSPDTLCDDVYVNWRIWPPRNDCFNSITCWIIHTSTGKHTPCRCFNTRVYTNYIFKRQPSAAHTTPSVLLFAPLSLQVVVLSPASIHIDLKQHPHSRSHYQPC